MSEEVRYETRVAQARAQKTFVPVQAVRFAILVSVYRRELEVYFDHDFYPDAFLTPRYLTVRLQGQPADFKANDPCKRITRQRVSKLQGYQNKGATVLFRQTWTIGRGAGKIARLLFDLAAMSIRDLSLEQRREHQWAVRYWLHELDQPNPVFERIPLRFWMRPAPWERLRYE